MDTLQTLDGCLSLTWKGDIEKTKITERQGIG